MSRGCVCAIVLVTAVLAGCSRDRWPEPPAVEAGEYQQQHQAWRDEQRAGLSYVLPIAGIWALPEGETPFGSDVKLPITLPAAHFSSRAGTFRRSGDAVTVEPTAGAALRLDDGSALDAPRQVDAVLSGPIRLEISDGGDGRTWVMAMDTSHPAVHNPPAVEAYPLDTRWRVAARFDAFDTLKAVRVPDVRGGFMNFTAVGELAFRIDDQEMRLTAFGEEGGEDYFVMFKDPTNQSTTYRGYRIVIPRAVKTGEFTVLDFNFAMNPPCAYSKFTTCPLPPPENRLPVAIEAGLKRLPAADGY
jgi:uncharacterized protein (DUF1684 family)